MKPVLFPNDQSSGMRRSARLTASAYGGADFGDAGKAVSLRPPTWQEQGHAGAIVVPAGTELLLDARL